jgi:UPF0716 family protein affecting phage T7 exclusion
MIFKTLGGILLLLIPFTRRWIFGILGWMWNLVLSVTPLGFIFSKVGKKVEPEDAASTGNTPNGKKGSNARGKKKGTKGAAAQ